MACLVTFVVESTSVPGLGYGGLGNDNIAHPELIFGATSATGARIIFLSAA